jgi:vacuolar-type H+-ATPase subunit H
MSTDSSQRLSDAVNGQAVKRVLEAEHAAEKAVQRCEQHARELIGKAQIQAQRIEQRCDQRITLIHLRCSQRLAEHGRVSARADRDAQQGVQASSIDRDAIKLAIEKLAAVLSGADGEDV